MAVVTAEATGALLLVASMTVPAGLLLLGGVLTVFTAAIVAALRRGDHAPCRCFGPKIAPLGRRHVVRNGLLFVVVAGAALTLLWRPAEAWRDGHPAGLLLALVAGLVGGMVVVLYDVLVELFAGAPTERQPLKGNLS